MHRFNNPCFKRVNGTAPPTSQTFAVNRHSMVSGLSVSAMAVAILFAAPAWAGGDGGDGGNFGTAGASGSTASGVGGAGGTGGGGGGSGGGGGGVGLLSAVNITNPNGTTIAGSAGGNGDVDPTAGGGGGGGGGEGLITSAGTITNNAGTLQGGNGGNAGNGATYAGGAGGGGAGLGTTGGTVTNSGTISGGNGGASPYNSGAGGGGVGVLANSATIFNDAGGAVSGGHGGTSTNTFVNGTGIGGAGAGGALGGALPNPGGGNGAIGILGGNLTVINKGTISGGLNNYPSGSRVNAITFSAGTNRLELRPGFSFVGNVVADGDDVLALGSDAADNGTINLPILVPPAYTGFSQYEKTGPGIWTVTGTQANAATVGWKVVDGKLNLGGGATLGAVTLAGGSLTGNGTVAQLVGGPGSVAPGNSVGTLTVTGTTTLAGANYAAEIDPAGSSADLLTVNGANLAGGTLTVTSLGGTPAVGQAFTVMSGTGITGTFGSVVYTDSFPGLTPSVEYSATSVRVVYAAAVVVPPGAAVAVPTLSQWGLALLALLLAGFTWRNQRPTRQRG